MTRVPSHPYISGPANIAQMVGHLRKNFPATVTAETVKKFSLAPNNESYVINALRFIGVLDDDSKRTPKGHDVFVLGNDEFPKAFESLIREAYSDLFETRGDDAWTLGRKDLVSYFRATDKTSDVIGARQAAVFEIFRSLSGHQAADEKAPRPAKPQTKPKIVKSKPAKAVEDTSVVVGPERTGSANIINGGRKDMALTVRIEINLPTNGTKETYDNIFQSIRANLIDE